MVAFGRMDVITRRSYFCLAVDVTDQDANGIDIYLDRTVIV